MQTLFSQEWHLVDSIQLESKDSITDFNTDDFNNLYYIRNFSELNKVNVQTKKIKTFSNQTVLENLNTQNILQITLKSGLFNLTVLDNQLNPIQQTIEFPIETSFMPTLTALVDNNYLWGYDPVIQRLVLWNYQENSIFRQSVILNEQSGDAFFPEMIYHQNKTYLIGYSKFLIFDEYANLETVIPFQEFDQIYIHKDQIYFSEKSQLFQLDLATKKISEISISHDFDYFSINSHYLFVLKGKVVYLYHSQKI